MSTKAVPAKAVPALGFTQFSTELPPGYALVIRRSDGSSALFRDHAAEIVVAPILSFASYFLLQGTRIHYQCEILPRAVPGMTEVSYPRELPTSLQKKITRKLQAHAKRLIYEQSNQPMITLEVGHGGAQFSCLVKLTADY